MKKNKVNVLKTMITHHYFIRNVLLVVLVFSHICIYLPVKMDIVYMKFCQVSKHVAKHARIHNFPDGGVVSEE